MLFKALSAAVYGIDANLIDVEVDYSGVIAEKEVFHTVGLPDAAVRESRDRVRAAIKNSGYSIPPTFITINLAPADMKKEGAGRRPEPIPSGWRAWLGRRRARCSGHVAGGYSGARKRDTELDFADGQRRRSCCG
jgi:hypothetical protein